MKLVITIMKEINGWNQSDEMISYLFSARLRESLTSLVFSRVAT